MAVEFPWRKEHQNAPGPSFVPGKPSTLPGVFCEFECMCVQGAFREEAHLACRQGGERRGGAGLGGEDERECGANVLQPEPQNCDPPRRALLEEKKKKSNGFSGILFSVHI